MDKKKVQVIKEWEPPTRMVELRSFLGLVNYYKRFIKSYLVRAAPLIELLKKNKSWAWTKACQEAFEDLKAVVMQEPVMELFNFSEPFEVYTDASNFAIGGVLMQERHPIAFKSHKLNETKRWYTVQEKEMTAVVHCLHNWRHYLLGIKFVIKIDNVATSYFQTQKKLTLKQIRWQDFLADFDYMLVYKPGFVNVVVDALSWKAKLVALSQVNGDLLGKIKQGMAQGPLAQQLVELAREGKAQRFWDEDGILYTLGRQIFVPKWANLRKELIKECHESKWVGHPR